MNAFLVISYLILSFLSPADLFPAIGAYRPMLLLSALGMLLAFISIMNQPDILRMPQLWLMACFYFIILIAYPLNGWLGGTVIAFNLFLVQAITLTLVITSANTPTKTRWIGWSLVIVSLYYLVRGVLAIRFGIEHDKYTVFQWYDETNLSGAAGFDRIRGAGIVSDPNDLAQVFLIALPFLWVNWRKHHLVNNVVWVLIPSALILYATFLTGSRGSLVGLFTLLAFSLKERLGMGGPILGAGFTAFLFLVVGFGGGRAISASGGTGGGRLELWSDAFGIFVSHPIWGIGINGITEYMKLTAHNSFVLCFTELGLLGYFFWIALLVVTIIPLRRIIAQAQNRPEFNELRRLTFAVLLALYAFLATGWFLSRTYATVLYVLLGLGGGLILQARAAGFQDLELPLPTMTKKTVVTMFGTIFMIYFMIRLRWA